MIVTVDMPSSGLRLDVFLCRHVDGLGRRAAQEAIATGQIRLNGRRARKSDLVHEGDQVELGDCIPNAVLLRPNPALEIPVLYEDDALVALDKPAGIPSVALRATETDTAANFLVTRFPETATVGPSPLEAGLVHRLDTETSGVLLAARTAPAYADLRRQFRQRQVLKDYIAVAEGDIRQPGEIRAPLVATGRHQHQMRVLQPGESNPAARAAVTIYRPLRRFGTATLLALRIETGVMHQIRAHLAFLGHPVIGDTKYGSRSVAPRQLLHATRLVIRHPDGGHRLSLTSSLAADIELYVGGLREITSGGPHRPRR